MERIEIKQAPFYVAVADDGEFNRGGGWEGAEHVVGIYDNLADAFDALKALGHGNARSFVREFYNPVQMGAGVFVPPAAKHWYPAPKPAAKARPAAKKKAAVRK